MVGPVSVGMMQRIVQTRLREPLARPILTRLHRATGGNPMMCLEMARALQRRGTEFSASDPLPVPADFRVLVTERLRGLAPQTRETLLLTAALAQPTVTAVAAAVGDAAAAARCLEEAVAAGVLEVDGERVRFTHPLIASIPYADLSLAARRALHERLASNSDRSGGARPARRAGLGRAVIRRRGCSRLRGPARPPTWQHRRRRRACPTGAQPHGDERPGPAAPDC